MKTATGYKSKVKGVVRLRNVTGFWKLTEVENGTKVQYQFLGDPGGNLPAWIINMMIVIGPFDTLVALKKKVK